MGYGRPRVGGDYSRSIGPRLARPGRPAWRSFSCMVQVSAMSEARKSPAAPVQEAADQKDARRLAGSIRALVRRFSISERSDVACCGMTVAQAATLETLLREGPLRRGDLGRRLGIAPSTLTRNLVRLEKRGLVARTEDSEDGRAA